MVTAQCAGNAVIATEIHEIGVVSVVTGLIAVNIDVGSRYSEKDIALTYPLETSFTLAKNRLVEIISCSLGMLRRGNRALKYLTRGCQIIIFASWIVCSKVFRIISVGQYE